MMQLQNLRLYWDGNNNVNSFAFKIVEVRSEYYLIPDGKKIDLQSPHSGWCVESAPYVFENEGQFKPRIFILNINFIPVEVGVAEFDIETFVM